MLIQTIYRYLYILIFLSGLTMGTAGHVFAQATDTTATDTTDNEPAKKKIQAGGHQLCLGVDILHPVMNQYTSNRTSYEFEVHYFLKNEFYGVAEGGWGGSTVNYPDLQYNTTNDFVRLGFNKSILTRENPNDWDMMFMGMRLAYTTVRRSAGTYTVIDSLWGSSSGSSSAKNFGALWAELTGGMRVELVKGLMAGWNLRGKFMLNGRFFKDLAPLNIAGYGRGDKNTAFDFNVYVSYAIRWRKAQTPPAKKSGTSDGASPQAKTGRVSSDKPSKVSDTSKSQK